MSTPREVKQGSQTQGIDETVTYSVDFTNWTASPASPSVIVKDVSVGGTDVTTIVMPSGSPSVSGAVVTLPPLKLLTIHHRYRVETKIVMGTDLCECFFWVDAEL